MNNYDAVIVGGGPIGGQTARLIAEKNYKTAIFERRKEIGTPINCAGLITPRVFEKFKISNKPIQNKIKGAHIHSPNNSTLTIGVNKTHALAINRELFDKEIIEKSIDNGAELYKKNIVLSAQRNNDKIELKTSKNIEVSTKILIGADGPHSKIRDIFFQQEPKEYLKGIGAEITNISIEPDYVHVIVGKNLAPGFFAWIIPINNKGTEARIGLCIDKKQKESPKKYLEKLISNSNFKEILKDVKINNYYGGIIPIGPIKKTYDSNMLLVGDAAAQVKPTSGGGIYPGMIGAKHAAETTIDALEKNDFSNQFLKRYQINWLKEFGNEINKGMRYRIIFKNLSDKRLDNYIKKFNNPKIIDIINKYGDIDYPSKLTKPLIKKLPLLLKLIPNIIKE